MKTVTKNKIKRKQFAKCKNWMMITLTSKTLVNESECVNTWIDKLNQNKVFSDRVEIEFL